MKFLKRFATVVFLGLSTMGLSACWGERVEVPPASVGMVMGQNGLVGDIIPPSRFRLAPCLFNCDKLVVIEAGDVQMKELQNILIGKDNLDMKVGLNFTIALSQNENELKRVFSRVNPSRLVSGNFGVSLEQIYNTYGSAIVTNAVRKSISSQDIKTVIANQTAISELIFEEIQESFKRTPLELREFTIDDLFIPPSVKEANEAVAQKQAGIARAEAEAQVKIREAQATLEVTRAKREADILAAQTTAEMNAILSKGVTPEVLRYMELQVLQEVSKNQNTIFFPLDMVGSTALQTRVMLTDTKDQK